MDWTALYASRMGKLVGSDIRERMKLLDRQRIIQLGGGLPDASLYPAAVIAAAYFPTGDVAIRPRLTYAVSDQWRATLGADVFRGPKLSYFGRVRDLSAAYVQFAYGF